MAHQVVGPLLDFTYDIIRLIARLDRPGQQKRLKMYMNKVEIVSRLCCADWYVRPDPSVGSEAELGVDC